MPGLRARRLAATGGATILAVTAFGLSTAGAERLSREQAASEATPQVAVPVRVFDPPASVGTTADRGPAGRVVLVFAVDDVDVGLTGSLDQPWVVVSSDGDYRALSAPRLPPARPGAVRVADDGSMLAWGAPGGVVVYDPVTDRARTIDLGVDGTPTMGPFSPDAEQLVVFDDRLRVVRLSDGEVLSTSRKATRAAARGAAWTPDGGTLTYTSTGAVVNHGVPGDDVVEIPTRVAPTRVSWDATGARLAVEERRRTGNRVRLLTLTSADEIESTEVLEREQFSLGRMLGFGAGSVVVLGRGADMGNLLTVSTFPLDDAPSAQLVALPQEEVLTTTLAVAADALDREPASMAEPDWPYPALAKLISVVTVTVFLLGLYLTRDPRRRSRRQDPAPSPRSIRPFNH